MIAVHFVIVLGFAAREIRRVARVLVASSNHPNLREVAGKYSIISDLFISNARSPASR